MKLSWGLVTCWGLVATVATAAPSCIEYFEGEGQGDRGGRATNEQKLGMQLEQTGHAQLLCESAITADNKVIRTKTEMTSGKIGYATGWQSANPLGNTIFSILKVNGQEVSEGVISIKDTYKDQVVCAGGNDITQFDKGMAIENKVGGASNAKITAYAFKTDESKTTLLAGEELFSIDASMLGCKLEVVVELPVPTSGDASFQVQMKIERDTLETEFNAGLSITATDTELHIITDQETADSMRNNTFQGDRTVMSMARGVVCGNTKTAVPLSAVTISDYSNFPSDNTFTYTIARADVQNCGVLYWDPMLTPFGGYETHVPSSASDTATLFIIVGAVVGVCLCTCMFVFVICMQCTVNAKETSLEPTRLA